jgi:FkbM family methyltransferase
MLCGKSWIRFMHTYVEEYALGNYEIAVQTTLAKILRPNMVFYDVGANAGFFSLLGAILVGPNGKVIAFEPHPNTAKLLKKQLRINEIEHVDVVCAAVSDKVGTAKLSDESASVMNSLIGAHKAKRVIEVKTTTIDEESKVRNFPDVLKIDVEGAEIDVLRGAEHSIRMRKPILLVEIHSHKIAIQYDQIMAEFGYETHDLEGTRISAVQSGARFVVSRPICKP